MRPGDVVSGWRDGWTTLCVVIATSRRKGSFGAASWLLTKEALDDVGPTDLSPAAADRVRSLVESQTPDRWHSITKAEVHACAADECDGEPGSWCAEGQGKGWVDVLAVSLSDVEAALTDHKAAT